VGSSGTGGMPAAPDIGAATEELTARIPACPEPGHAGWRAAGETLCAERSRGAPSQPRCGRWHGSGLEEGRRQQLHRPIRDLLARVRGPLHLQHGRSTSAGQPTASRLDRPAHRAPPVARSRAGCARQVAGARGATPERAGSPADPAGRGQLLRCGTRRTLTRDTSGGASHSGGGPSWRWLEVPTCRRRRCGTAGRRRRRP